MNISGYVSLSSEETPYSDPPQGGGYTYTSSPDFSFPFYYNTGTELPRHKLGSTLTFHDAPSDPCLPGGGGAGTAVCAFKTQPTGSSATQLAGVNKDGSATNLKIGRRLAPSAGALLLAFGAACSSGQSREPNMGSRSEDRAASDTSTPAAAAGSCTTVDVHSVRVGVVDEPQALADTLAERIETLPASATPGTTILATGPMLGSMDSREVRTEIACTPDGATVTATLTRSADYAGGVKKNVLWRPTLTVVAEPRGAAAMLRVTWRMRLSNGVEQDRAQTPPYEELRYPRTLEARIVARH